MKVSLVVLVVLALGVVHALDPAPLKQLEINMTGYTGVTNPNKHDAVVQPGAAVAVGHEGKVVSLFSTGYAQVYQDENGTLLPEDQRIPARTNTIWDMASLTKMFTTVAALRELDRGAIKLDAKVADYIPLFATNQKQNVTILQLLTHTSGFDADPDPLLYEKYFETDKQRHMAQMMAGLKNTPGSEYLYSDLNFMNLQLVLEAVTGKRLDMLIHDYTSKLGMHDTFFNRGDAAPLHLPKYSRMAAQEYQIAVMGDDEPTRPQPVRGTVHDENAWSTSGVSGHAGLFSTVEDVGRFCQMILNNGTMNGVRILSQTSVDNIFHNYNARFGEENSHGLGFELNQRYWSGAMAGPNCAGHTGFTGTTLAMDRDSNTWFLMFANHVHPSRNWGSNNIAREAVGYWVAKALGKPVDSFPY